MSTSSSGASPKIRGTAVGRGRTSSSTPTTRTRSAVWTRNPNASLRRRGRRVREGRSGPRRRRQVASREAGVRPHVLASNRARTTSAPPEGPVLAQGAVQPGAKRVRASISPASPSSTSGPDTHSRRRPANREVGADERAAEDGSGSITRGDASWVRGSLTRSPESVKRTARGKPPDTAAVGSRGREAPAEPPAPRPDADEAPGCQGGGASHERRNVWVSSAAARVRDPSSRAGDGGVQPRPRRVLDRRGPGEGARRGKGRAKGGSRDASGGRRECEARSLETSSLPVGAWGARSAREARARTIPREKNPRGVGRSLSHSFRDFARESRGACSEKLPARVACVSRPVRGACGIRARDQSERTPSFATGGLAPSFFFSSSAESAVRGLTS